jgi:uncharacterized protein (DUF849 family)
MSGQTMLQAALNGAREPREHPLIPRTPAELAADARKCVGAGAKVVHVHAFDDDGIETLAPDPNGSVLAAIRAACPGVPISLTTRAEIEPEAGRRLELIMRWTELPDLVTANQGDSGIVDICDYLSEHGVGIEAGLLELADAEIFVRSRIAPRCVRLLFEPLDAEPDDAVAHAQAMEKVIDLAEITLSRVYHGDGIASWAVNHYGLSQGHGIRTGLEDTTVLPDGTRAADNTELIDVAKALILDQNPEDR